MIEKSIIWIFLAAGSVWDIRKKSIPVQYLWVFGITGLICLLIRFINGMRGFDFVLAFLPGIFFLILAYISGEQIGMGDGLVILCTGFFLRYGEIVYVTFVSFLCLTLVSMVLYAVGRANRKTKIPFLPFWLMGFTIYVLGEII